MLVSGISEARLSAPLQPWRQFRAVSRVSPSAVNWPLLCACFHLVVQVGCLGSLHHFRVHQQEY